MAYDIVTGFQDLATDERFIQTLKQTIRSKVFNDDINNFFTFKQGVKGGDKLAVVRDIDKITLEEDGCNGTSINPAIPALQQTWEMKRAKVNIKKCYTEFEGTFEQWGLANGYQAHDLGESEFIAFLLETYSDAMAKDLLRVVLTGDAAILATGTLIDGATDEKNYDWITKGFIPTLEAMALNAEFSDQFIVSTQNLAPGAQQVFAADDMRNYLRDVTDTLDFDADQILMNYKSYRAYENEFLNPAVYPAQSTQDVITNGIKTLPYGGIPVKFTKAYDRIRANDFEGVEGSLTAADTHKPHFICYANKSNLIVGVDSTEALSNLKMEYIGGSDENFYLKGNYMLDFKIADPYAIKAVI